MTPSNGSVGGTVVVVHGLGEHSGRYARFVSELSEKGLKVVTFDLPGHGKSPGVRGHLRFSDVFDILDELTRNIGTHVLFGHSLGGLIAVRYVQERYRGDLKGLVISAPALTFPRKVSQITKTLLKVAATLVPILTVDNGIDPSHLSRNEKAVEAYKTDPLVHRKISLALVVEILKNIEEAFKKVERVRVPTLLLLGTEDKVVPPEGSRRFFELLKVEKEKVEFPGAYHEIFEDPEYQNVFYEMVSDWILRKLRSEGCTIC